MDHSHRVTVSPNAIRDHPHWPEEFIGSLKTQSLCKQYRSLLQDGLFQAADHGVKFAAALQVPEQRRTKLLPVVQDSTS